MPYVSRHTALLSYSTEGISLRSTLRVVIQLLKQWYDGAKPLMTQALPVFDAPKVHMTLLIAVY